VICRTEAEAAQAGYQAGLQAPLTKAEANRVALILASAGPRKEGAAA
jgi:hypothetical protein